MRTFLIDLLTCPDCAADTPLEPDGFDPETDAEVETGFLRCTACGSTTEIRNGIPRFVQPNEDYCENFGFQWNEWRTLQVDRLSGHNLSTDRFFCDSGWSPDWLKGKLILDAGCGAGRFADVAAQHGATIVAVDLSNAIDACRETTAVHDGKVQCVQASLLDLPLKDGVFDGVYCMGVIQHTPDPEGVMRALPRRLKPAGALVYNFYEEGLWRRLQVIKYLLRLFTPHLSNAANMVLSRILVTLLFPLTRFLARIPKVRILNHFIPIASVHDPQLSVRDQQSWTLLDTFDWYGARYEKRQHHDQVAALLRDAGLERVHSRDGLAWGAAPPPDAASSNVD